MTWNRDPDELPFILGGAFFILAGLVVFFAPFGCSAEPLRAGFVVRRVYHPHYTTTVCTPQGKSMVCTPVFHPERYSLTLADGDHEEREVDMTEEAWRAHPVGSWACLHAPPCEHPHDDARP